MAQIHKMYTETGGQGTLVLDASKARYLCTFGGDLTDPKYGVESQGTGKLDVFLSWGRGLPSVEHTPIWSDPSEAVEVTMELSSDTWDTRVDTMANLVAERFFAVPEVEAVFFAEEEGSVEIWTVMNHLDRAARQKIHEAEYDLLGRFPEIDLEFHVICRNDRDLEDIRPSGTRTVAR